MRAGHQFRHVGRDRALPILRIDCRGVTRGASCIKFGPCLPIPSCSDQPGRAIIWVMDCNEEFGIISNLQRTPCQLYRIVDLSDLKLDGSS